MGELSVRELPLFPLPEVVLFPQEVLPLHIFESRYRIMLQSVLESDSMFGVIKWDPTTKSMANVGCCAQIIKHQTAEDGRSNIITLGQQRFQVLEITRSTPFCSAMVSWISDDNIDDLQKLDSLKDSVKEALNDAETEGWAKPSKIRFWRASMKSIIRKSIENLGIEPLVSRRTYELFDRI